MIINSNFYLLLSVPAVLKEMDIFLPLKIKAIFLFYILSIKLKLNINK